MKQELVSAHAARRGRIESGDEVIVGVNKFETTEPSPLTADLDGAIMAADPQAEASALRSVEEWKAAARRGRRRRGAGAAGRRREDRHQPDGRDPGRGPGRRDHGGVGRHAARGLRRVPGAHRRPRRGRGRPRRATSSPPSAPGCRRPARSSAAGCGCWSASPGSTATPTVPSRSPCARATPASRSSTRASGSRPEQIVAAAVAEDVHCVGLSILSGSHMELVPDVLDGLREAGLDDVPVIVGGIIPESDGRRLGRAGRRRGLHAQGLRADRDHGRHRRPDPAARPHGAAT